MSEIHGLAVHAAGAQLLPYKFDPGDLKPYEVEIKISHCGVCHSDVHLINNDWSISKYPFIPGHEIVGTIVGVGEHVRNHTAGQRVGVGWQADSCGICEWCVRGDEHLCARSQPTCVGRHGGFADKVRVNSRFAIPLPKALDSENAAPLLCAGITVYTPLRNYGVRPSSRVGVIGIGGLGHLGIQFAKVFGAEVTAFSTSKEKEKRGSRAGCASFRKYARHGRSEEGGWHVRSAAFDCGCRSGLVSLCQFASTQWDSLPGGGSSLSAPIARASVDRRTEVGLGIFDRKSSGLVRDAGRSGTPWCEGGHRIVCDGKGSRRGRASEEESGTVSSGAGELGFEAGEDKAETRVSAFLRLGALDSGHDDATVFRFGFLVPAVLSGAMLAQGTKLWTVDRYDVMERGSVDGVAIRSDGRLESGPAKSMVYDTGKSYVWSLASDKSRQWISRPGRHHGGIGCGDACGSRWKGYEGPGDEGTGGAGRYGGSGRLGAGGNLAGWQGVSGSGWRRNWHGDLRPGYDGGEAEVSVGCGCGTGTEMCTSQQVLRQWCIGCQPAAGKLWCFSRRRISTFDA